MNTTLYDFFMDADFDQTNDFVWRIYGSYSKRLLCKDYGNSFNSELDNLKVTGWHKRDDRWIVYVDDSKL